MSDEIAQTAKEEHSFSEAIVRDIPDTYLESSSGSTPKAHEHASSKIPALADSAEYPSSPSPQPSQLAYNLSAGTSAADRGAAQASSSKAPEQGQYLGQDLAPSVPQRSSSHSKLSSATTTSMPDSSATNPTTVSKRGSKRSLKPKSRSGSLASSRSKDAAVAVDTQRPGKSHTEIKRRRRFLSFLNCCTVPENANEVELGEQEVPAIKANVVQPKPERQATPLVKTTSNPGETSKAGSTKPLQESIGGPEYSELKSAAKPEMKTRSSKDKISLDQSTAPSGATGNAPDPPEKPPLMAKREPPLPPLPPSSDETQHVAQRREEPLSKAPATAAEPPQTIVPDESVAVQGTTINDRTPNQEAQDSDIAMPDAPPIPTARETPLPSSTQALAPTQMALPPPPPRDGQDRSVPTTANATPNEKQQWLLPPLQPELQGRKCLVLDLDETLVHSSFKILHNADFTIPVEIEGQFHNVYVIKRPGVDQFMKRVGELYEVVVFTASVSKYGDPLLDQLDINKVVHHRLFRESCYHHQGNYVKVSHTAARRFSCAIAHIRQDLSQVGRDLRETIIIDNSPTSYIFHPQHAVPISSWFSDAHDNELLDLIPVLEDLAGSSVRDVSMVLDVSL
ncbi:MAG: hypothetical protein Q9163_001374 [Psora crenata]